MYDFMMEFDLQVLESEHEMITEKFESLESNHLQRMYDIENGFGFMESSMAVQARAYYEEMSLYTEGVKELWEKFKAFVGRIIDKIRKMFDPNYTKHLDPNEMVETDNLSAIKKSTAAVKGIINNIADIHNDKGEIDPVKLGRRLGIAGAGYLSWKLLVKDVKRQHKKPIKKKRSEQHKSAKQLEKEQAELARIIQQMNGANFSESDIAFVQSLAGSCLTDGASAIKQVFTSAKDKVGDAVDRGKQAVDNAHAKSLDKSVENAVIDDNLQKRVSILCEKYPKKFNKSMLNACVRIAYDKNIADGDITIRTLMAVREHIDDTKLIDFINKLSSTVVKEFVESPKFDVFGDEDLFEFTDTYSSIFAEE